MSHPCETLPDVNSITSLSLDRADEPSGPSSIVLISAPDPTSAAIGELDGYIFVGASGRSTVPPSNVTSVTFGNFSYRCRR